MLHQARPLIRQKHDQPTAGLVRLPRIEHCADISADNNSDLIKAETPHLGPRIQLMLSQLEFKLSVEKQYKDGIEKMVRLYQIEGDRKSRSEAEGRRIESSQKMVLLKSALKRHEELHVDIGADVQDGAYCPKGREDVVGMILTQSQMTA